MVFGRLGVVSFGALGGFRRFGSNLDFHQSHVCCAVVEAQPTSEHLDDKQDQNQVAIS